MKTKFIAEMVGTMVLVLMGCGAAVLNGGATSVAAVLTIAFAFGLSVVAMAYTIGVWLNGGLSVMEAGVYIVAQVTGGILGSALLWLITDTMGIEGTGANGFEEPYLLAAFVAEAVFTFIFVLTVLGTTDRDNGSPHFAGLAIGLTLVLVHIVCIPVTGTSVNPARSIGPALFAGMEAISQLWLFIVAPIVGAVVAVPVWKTIKGN
ncbi:aquaporin [Bacteroides ovatus]|uniref:aquaporin n=2 Tax=Bacteroides ovatus TaxID=28116 RepID=UPI00202F2943|nr:aquaporin [Bacteroides ovatus]MCM1722296.1 aquaporin [Bacteroides ovatus]MCM1757837.1 aquaporin [Bacteroides ovatus]MCM1867887.1 aquaporin [Bacteroides ovatus]MDC2385107.1 aquaporin [Bacteroides ovatus]